MAGVTAGPTRSAQAEYGTAAEFVAACSGPEPEGDVESGEQGYCRGYLAGILDAFAAVAEANSKRSMVCPPAEGMDDEFVLDALSQWVADDEVSGRQPVRATLLKLLVEAYPCKEETPAEPTQKKKTKTGGSRKKTPAAGK